MVLISHLTLVNKPFQTHHFLTNISIMKSIYTYVFSLSLAVQVNAQDQTQILTIPDAKALPEVKQTLPSEKNLPLIKISSTSQDYNIAQPWEKKPTKTKRGLGVLIGENQIITTAEMATNATYIELETIEGKSAMPATTIAVDYEANLALLSVTSESHKEILAQLTPLEVAPSASLNDEVKVYQIKDSGKILETKGVVRGADIVSSFVANNYFLTYEVKASMQSASYSFTIPVIKNGKLLGILTSYNSDDQLLDITAPEIIQSFLDDAKDGEYTGFPSLGISTSRTDDPHFRKWLKLEDTQGGLFIKQVKRNSTAQKAGIEAGDVLLKIDGNKISRKGYYESKKYGPLYWSHLIRGTKKVGETLSIELIRDGKIITKKVELTRQQDGLIPSHMFGKAPRYLIKGGFVFQELSKSYLQGYGEKWKTRAPIDLLDVLNHPEDYEEGRKRLVILSRTIPTEATLGYERISAAIINKVNGTDIADIPSLVKAFETPGDNGLHTIELDNVLKTLYLDAETANKVDASFLQRGLPSLSRVKE